MTISKTQKWLLAIGILAFATLLYFLKPILMPFLVGALLAYLGDPLVQRLERWHLPRTVAVLATFLLIIIAVLAFFLLLIPQLQNQIIDLLSKTPLLIDFAQTKALPWLNQQAAMLDIPNNFDFDSAKELIASHWQQAGNAANTAWKIIAQSGLTLVAWIINIMLIPVVTFYLLRDWPTLLSNIKNLLPRHKATQIIKILKECDEVLSAFFRGQLIVMLALGCIYAIGLKIVGLNVALLIGLIAGLLSIVPYLGFSIGLILALLAALLKFQDATHLVYVLIVFIIGNVLEGMVLTPWLVGDKIGLHPVAVIFAVLAGGQLFGFIGVLVALPVAAVLMVLLRHLQHQYKSSNLYQ